MDKSCLTCKNREDVFDDFVVCRINGYIENIYMQEVESTGKECPCYKYDRSE